MAKFSGKTGVDVDKRHGIATPTNEPASLRRSLLDLKSAVEEITRQRGNVGDSAVTVKDLIKLGLMSPHQQYILRSLGAVVTVDGEAGISSANEEAGGASTFVVYEFQFSDDGDNWEQIPTDNTSYMRIRQYESGTDPDSAPWLVVPFGAGELDTSDLPEGSLLNIEFQFSKDKITWYNSYTPGDVWARFRTVTQSAAYSQPVPPAEGANIYMSFDQNRTFGMGLGTLYSVATQTAGYSMAVGLPAFDSGKHYFEVVLTQYQPQTGVEMAWAVFPTDYDHIGVGLWNRSAPWSSGIMHAEGVPLYTNGWYFGTPNNPTGPLDDDYDLFSRDGITQGSDPSVTFLEANGYDGANVYSSTFFKSWRPHAGWAPSMEHMVLAHDGNLYKNGAVAVSNLRSTAPSQGDTISVALDLDNDKVWFGRNGSWDNGDPATNTGGYSLTSGLTWSLCVQGGNNVCVYTLPASNAYTIPSGFTFYAAGSGVPSGDLSAGGSTPDIRADIAFTQSAFTNETQWYFREHAIAEDVTKGIPAGYVYTYYGEGNPHYYTTVRVSDAPMATGLHYFAFGFPSGPVASLDWPECTSTIDGSWTINYNATIPPAFGIVDSSATASSMAASYMSNINPGESLTVNQAMDIWVNGAEAAAAPGNYAYMMARTPAEFGFLVDADLKKCWLYANGEPLPEVNGGDWPAGGINLQGTAPFYPAFSLIGYTNFAVSTRWIGVRIFGRLLYEPQGLPYGTSVVQAAPLFRWSDVGVGQWWPEAYKPMPGASDAYSEYFTVSGDSLSFTDGGNTSTDLYVVTHPGGRCVEGEMSYAEWTQGGNTKISFGMIGVAPYPPSGSSYGLGVATDVIFLTTGGAAGTASVERRVSAATTTYSNVNTGENWAGAGAKIGVLYDDTNKRVWFWGTSDGDPANGVWVPDDPNSSGVGYDVSGWTEQLPTYVCFETTANTGDITITASTVVNDVLPLGTVVLNQGSVDPNSGWTVWRFEHGASLWVGTTAPADTTGYDGDGAVTLTTGQLYTKTSGSWGTTSSLVVGDNRVAATGPVGNVTGKIQVFDKDGNSLGYLPLYDAIT